MTSWSGKSIAHYRISALVGVGGMGEVYRASDPRLGRDVAVKVLPPAFANNAERMALFEREARVLASLSHPNIAAIHGLEKAEGAWALVMEMVEGPTLADRLARGPLPLDEALGIGLQVAEALEYAHERGIVHRDLKPANVKLTPEGKAKVLDFGLAKALFDDPYASASDIANSPTLTVASTKAGMILGTASYMSPEQAKGKPVDRRADIWAFGALLYEMLTARMTFEGETVSEILAAILKDEPDWTALPPSTPAGVHQLLRRCLQKDPRQRLRDIGEARIALHSILVNGTDGSPAGASGPIPRTGRMRPPTPVVVTFAALAALGGLGLGFLVGRRMSDPARPMRQPAIAFGIQDSTNRVITGSLAFSPDGTHLVYARRSADGQTDLLVRRMDEEAGRVLQGTHGAQHPFWSPDGRDIAFSVGNTLHRVSLTEGGATTMAHLPDRPLGGTWNQAGVILVGTFSGPLYQVMASGGTPVALTELEPGFDDSHVWPVFFPDGEHFVFLADGSTDAAHRVTVRSLHGKDSKVIRTAIRSAIMVDPRGALLMVVDQQLFAWPFDFGKREFTGPQVLVENAVQTIGVRHETPATLSGNGMLAFQRGNDQAVIMRLPLDGSEPRVLTTPDRYRNPRIFDDGNQITYEIQMAPGERTIWAQDLARGTRTLISFRNTMNDSPVWSADGEWIYFGANQESRWGLYRKRVLGAGPPELVSAAEGYKDLAVMDCSRDGRWVLISPDIRDEGISLYLGALGSTPVTFKKWSTTRARERFARFSPDSRWIAFQSEASGQDEVYVAPVEGGPSVRQWMVSLRGGSDPAWSPDGTRLYYRDLTGTLMAVPIAISSDRVEARPPERLFDLRPPDIGFLRNVYDPTPDGKAVIAFIETQTTSPAIQIRTGWGTAK